jgi:hypothetical protein
VFLAQGSVPPLGAGGTLIQPIWVFLAHPVSLRKPPLTGVGNPWISLDSLVRIVTFQWVTREKRRTFFLDASWPSNPGTNSVFCCGGQDCSSRKLNVGSDFPQSIVARSDSFSAPVQAGTLAPSAAQFAQSCESRVANSRPTMLRNGLGGAWKTPLVEGPALGFMQCDRMGPEATLGPTLQ